MGLVARWAAVAAVAAGVWVGGAREANADAGDTVYWKNNTSYTNWNADAWYNTTRSWDDHNPNYCGHNRLFFDNNNKPNMGNNFSGTGLAFWQVIFTNGASSTRTIRGSASTATVFYDWGGTNPKIENYESAEHRLLFLVQIGEGKVLEVNPIGGNLSLSKVYAAGQTMNVYGSKTLFINDWYAGTNSASAPSTMYVSDAAHVVVTNWRAGTSSYNPWQTVHVNNAGGQVDVRQVSGLSSFEKKGPGKMVYGGNAGSSGTQAQLLLSAGTLVISNFSTTTSPVMATNINLTNTTTVVMKSPAQFRKVVLNAGSVVEMDVFNNSSAAYLGVVPGSTTGTHQFAPNSSGVTLKLKGSAGFDPTAKACWTVFNGRNAANAITAAEAGYITLDTSDLVNNWGADGTFSGILRGTNSASSSLGSALYVTYSPSTPQDPVGLTQTTFTYNGSAITLTGTGGSGTGAYSYALVSGGTGTGTVSGNKLTPTAAGTFFIDVTRAASGSYPARTDRVTVTVNKGTQAAVSLSTTTFTWAGSALTLTGSGGTAGTYSYAYGSNGTGSGSVSGGKLTATAAGTMTVNVTRSGNNLYNSRTDAVTVTVNKGTQAAVSLSTTTFTWAGSAITLSGSGGTAGTYSYAYGSNGTGSGSVSGGKLTATAAGTMTIKVTRSGNDLWNSRTDNVSVTVNKGTQAAVGLATTTFTYAPGGLTLTGNGGSGTGAYSYAYKAAGTGSGSVSGSTLTVTASGTMTVTVTRVADSLWNAKSADVVVTVNKAAQTVGFTTSPLMVTAGKSTTVAAAVTSPASGGGAVTFSGNNDAVATVTSAGSVTGVAAGQVTITATAAATANYAAGTATYVLTVRTAPPATSGSITSVTAIGADTFKVTYTKGSDVDYNVLLAKEGAAPTAPEDGTGAATVTGNSVAWTSGAVAYPSGNSDGTKAIQHRSVSSATVTVTAATPATHYYLALYGRKPTGTSGYTNFVYSATASTIDFWTLAAEPTGNPSLVAPTAAAETLGSGSATINWTKGAGANNTLVVLYGPADSEAAATALAETAPTDGQVYSTGSGLGGTILHAGAGTTAVASGLTKLKWYKVVAYSCALGGDDSTANYLVPGASITFQTQDSNGPQVWATGVDGTSFLLNWSPVAGASTGYDVGAGGEIPLLDDGFTTDEGWATASSSSGYKTAASGKWLLASLDITAASSSTDDNKSHAFFPYNVTATLELPPLTGTVTSVSAYLGVPSANVTERGLVLEYYNGSAWTSLGTVSAVFDTAAKTNQVATLTLGAERDVTGQRLRLSRMNANSVFLFHLWVNGSAATGVKGHDMAFTGLTSGDSYTAKVRKNPSGDWSDTLVVKAGVMPGEISADALRDSVTFTWTDEEDGAVGYKVDATTEEPASATVVYACPTNNGLGTNQWSNGSSWLQWEYTGTVSTESVTSDYIKKGPGYVSYNSASKGHYLIGRAGQAVVSTNFDLEGATNAVLTFDNCAWNSANASTTIESSRLDVYFRLDGTNEWNYFATCIATNTGDNKWVSQSMPLPRGALDGDTLAVKIVAPNAEYYNSALRGAGVRNIKLTLQKAAGRYGPGHSLAGYPKTIATPSSHTVTGLDPETKVHFRVQALQGSTNAPTAKSVWVEGEGETSGLVASATAQEDGTILVTWIPPTGTGVVILRGRDERHDPATPLDLANLPDGYEIVRNATGGAYWENTSPSSPVEQSCVDSEPLSGWKYYYYIYAATVSGDTVTVGAGPSRTATGETPNAVVKGMVNAIASQGWDGWDVHPWSYRKGRVTNPGPSSDGGWWAANGMSSQNVRFYESWETDARNSASPTGQRYADYYGTGAGADDVDRTNQLGITSLTNYYGDHSFRLSGGGSYNWSSGGLYINTNNAAIEFGNVDLSGYKNVQFSMHIAATNLGKGGDDLHVAISTNGGTTWVGVSATNAARWYVMPSSLHYGREIIDGNQANDGNWDFYYESFEPVEYTYGGATATSIATPEGNPYVLYVPDGATQFMVRVMYYDSNNASKRKMSYFIDEVRLVGEAAMPKPHPVLTNIAQNAMTVRWDPVAGADGYTVKLTKCEKATGVKLQQGFVLNVLEDGWTGDGYAMPATANRSGTGYGVLLDGNGDWVSTPLVGAAHTLTFWTHVSTATSGNKLFIEGCEEGSSEWKKIAELNAGSVATAWGSATMQTVNLPRRQWQKIRFRKATSGANWYIDDVTVYGGGDYTGCSTPATTVTLAGNANTSKTFTGLTAGQEYFVEVQAYGAPAGYTAYSDWEETAGYTAGDFSARADGFEMARLGWAASSDGILVVAVTNGDASAIATPGVGDTVSVGTEMGTHNGIVIANTTSAQAASPGYEHVWPHGARTEDAEAKYLVFWKHGDYWEGRLETNVVLGTYVCQAADAMAITNATAVPAGTQGKGWAAGWKPWDDDDAKASPDYISVLRSATTESGYTYYGLVGSNKLAGAGGNAIRFAMTDNNRKLRLARALSAPVTEGEVWIMFQVRSQYGGDNDDKMFGMQLSTGTDAATAGDGIFASIGNMKYRYGDGDARAPRLQIDTSVDGSWPGGSGISWDQAASGYTPYELKDTDNQGSGTHTVVIKYDVGAKKIYAAGIYTTSAATIANNGPLAPNSAAPAFHCEATLSSKKTLGTIILLGKGYNGNLDFDEVRVGSSWEDIVGKETEAPFPVTSATAWTDGNELVRISWTYAAAGSDGGIDRPLADGVRIYAREGTSGEWTEIYKGKGTNEAAVAAGGVSRWDHVVAPGSVHQYQVVAYASGKSAAAVDAVLKDSAPASYSVETGLYGETEYVNPFAYTNWAVASTAAGLRWLGGNGFGDNYWSPGSGSAGVWSIATPEEAQSAVHITNAVMGSRLAAGNVLKVVVGNGETASIDRTLVGDAWCGKGGETFYVAFRMAYQWGDQGGRQVGLRLTDDGGKYVQFGKARGDDSGYQHRFGVTASPNGTGYTSGWSTSGDDMNGYGNASGADYVDNAYLVVGKVNWSSDGKANLRGVKYLIGNNGSVATLPSEEKDVTWEASYDNAGIGAIRKIELIAGTENSGYGTIGTAWFDEIRFGKSWEDIVGATEPEDAWVDGISATVYLGDFARWYMYGWPKGAKQSAWVSLATDTAFTTVLATNDTEWVDNQADRGKERTKWQGKEIQFTQTGTLYGGGSVKGELVTANSWTRTAADECKWNTYTVDPLPVPIVDSAVGGTAKISLAWTPATESGRTFSEVMVVRYTGGTVPTPVQGTTYTKGQTFGGGTVVYRGTAGSYVDKGLTKDTTYNYAFFTVNNSYYSAAATASADTDKKDPEIEIDGDPGDWVGVPSDVKNSSTLSSGEWIWTDKVLDGRVDKNEAYDADITEFRMKVDGNGYVNFMARLHCLTNRQNPYISVGIVTNVDATQLAATGNEDGENWIGDESATFMGGNLFDPASLHYADIQMAVHWVTTAGENGVASGSGGWVVELYRKDGNSWFAPVQAWEAASSANGAEDPCIEWKVKRSDLGLDYANVTPARFTVASFANAGGWNNDTEATVDLSSGTSHAVDTLSIAPWGVNDKNLSLGAWDEGIQKGNAEYWFDIWFGPTSLHNAAPNAPGDGTGGTDNTYSLDGITAANGQKVSASPTMRWGQCADHDDIGGTHGDLGFVVGYLVEVSTNEYFNGLEGTTENGPVSLRVNIKGADNTNYLFKTDSRYYWWRVRARDNSGALSAPTPWHYEVEGKTDNEGPVARLLFVGKDEDVARYVSDPAFRHEEDMSGDATSVLDSDLEDGGHTFGFVLEWYDVNGVFATNWFRASKDGEGDQWPKGSGKNPYDPSADYNPNVGDFAWSIQSHHGDGTPYGRVSPNWDLVIVDRSTVSHEEPTTQPAQPAAEMVGGVAKTYMWTNAMVLPTDDGGTETIWGWVIDCGLDHVFQPTQTINDGNDGQYITNHVQGAFSIGTYRTDLDIYLTVSAEDGCRTGPYAETADYDWPLYAENGSTGSYQANNSPSWQVSGWCAAAPNPSRNVTTNQLLHIHVRDNDTVPPVTSQAKWRADATSGGKVLLPMMAMTVGGASSAPAGWDPTWDNLGAQGRVPTHEGQGKALEWQLTDGDVSTYTHPATAGGTGTQAWKGSANPIRLFFNVYDEYLHSGLASFTAYSARPTASGGAPTKTDGAAATGSYISQANKTRSLDNTALQLGGAWNYFATADTEVIAAKTYYTRSGDTYTPAVNPSSTAGLYERKWVAELNWAGYKPAWSKITQFPWEDTGANTHGWGTGPDTVLAWQLDASEANVTNLVGRHDILAALGTGVDAEGAQVAFTNDVKLLAWDNDNNAAGDQLAAELAFGRVLFSDDDATPPEMASFTSLGTGTNFTWFGRLGQWTFGDSASAPVFTATPLMPAITLSTEVTLHQYATASDPSRHWNSSSHTIYYDGAGGRATDWNQTGAPYFEFTLKGNGNTVWNADMIGFENRVAQAGPTLYALTVQAPTLALVNEAVDGGAINTADGWTGANVDVATYNSKEAIRLLTASGSATFGPQACEQLTGLTVECDVAAYGTLTSTTGRKLKIQYKATGDADWTDLPGGSYTVSSFSSQGVYVPFSYDLANVPGLLGSGKEVQIRVYGTDLGSGTGQGYAVAGLKVTVARGDAVETLLGRMVIEKEMDETGGHFKTETVTSVIFGFDRPVQCAVSDNHIFRLYAFDATRYNSDGVLEHLSDMPSSGGWTFTWGIKNLFLHGTATEPKKSEVTDYDVAKGAWTNNLEVLDGAMAGYDTVRSGVRVKDASGEVSGEKPSFRILYPSAYDGAAPNSDPNGVVSGGELILRSVSSATFNHLSDPEFTAGTSPWTLSASGATVAGGKLTLAEGASAYAKQTVALDAMSGVRSATVSGTVRAKGTKATDAGGVNKLTVTAKVYSKANELMKTLTEDIVTTSRAKNYPVGPWVLNYDNVGSVEFTVGQTDETATELVVESLSGYVAQWGADITEADAAWATTVTNGMEAAKVLVRTPELDLTTTSVPLSIEGSGHSQPADQWYKLEATVHDFDGDRAGDALSTSATTNFWLYDDDVLAPQWGAKFDSPMGIFMGGTIISLKARRNSGADQIWPILDSDLTALAPSAEVLFSLSAYDYSGWKTTGFAVGSETVQDGAAVASAAATAGWSQTAAEGAPESPAATNTWSITAKDLYTAHKDDFKASAGVTAELTANTTDLDNDRKDDSLATGSSRVGYAWFADQDVSAPGWGSQTTPYYGLMISTGVGASAGLADLIGTEEAPAPYALGGAANNQGEFAGRSYTVYDGQLKAAGTEGDNQFVITANLNDPLPTDAGARARHPTGLKRGSTLTESAAMWGDSSVAANVFTVTNTHLVIQTPWTGGAGSLTNVAFSEAFTDPAIGKTRINTQAGHTSWTWNFPTNDIGKLLPPSETVAALTLKVQAYDADANRHEDQKHAELVGPTITLRDDDTQAPSRPAEVKVNNQAVASGTITRENAPWTNDLSQIQVSWTASEDPEPTGTDIKKAGVAGYRLASAVETIDPDAGSALTGTITNGTTVSKALSGVTMLQGWDNYKLFAVDADADRPGDAMVSPTADLPLAYDITKPTEIGYAAGEDYRLKADPDNTDDPTTQFDLTWPISGTDYAGVGPDDPDDEEGNYDAIPEKYKTAATKANDVLSPWYSYKIYYGTFNETDVPADDDPCSETKSYIYTTYVANGAYKSWASVDVSTNAAADPSAPATPYASLGAVTENAGTGKQTVRLYDLDFDQHYAVVIVGVDKAGNEGPAGRWSWATNNTIKFAVTQGVVKARAIIQSEVEEADGGETMLTDKFPEENPPKYGVVLSWLAAGMKEDKTTHSMTGRVTKTYDLIFRDAQSFTETGHEQWIGEGTTQTNWNYQADAGLKTPRRLRFFRASYHDRWQDTKPGTSQKQRPLASEEVYSMNNIILSEGRNYVSLQGVPYTNTFEAVFGTDTAMWPGGSTLSDPDGTIVQFYKAGASEDASEDDAYYFGTDGRWHNQRQTDVTETVQSDGFFSRPFCIVLPEAPRAAPNTVVTGGWWAVSGRDEKLGATWGSVSNGVPRELCSMMWHPIMQVPTNGPVTRVTAGVTNTYYEQSVSRVPGRYSTLSLNLPVEVGLDRLGLVEKDEDGNDTQFLTVSAELEEMVGFPMPMMGDQLYVLDTKTKQVRRDSTIYCVSKKVGDAWTNTWKFVKYNTQVPGNFIKPNDMIVVIANEEAQDAGGADPEPWIWRYSPEDFYDLPDRHMGRSP